MRAQTALARRGVAVELLLKLVDELRRRSCCIWEWVQSLDQKKICF